MSKKDKYLLSGILSCWFTLLDITSSWLYCIGINLLYKKRCWVFFPCVEGFPRITSMLCSGVAHEDAYGWVAMEQHCLWKNKQTHKSLVYHVHGYLLVILDICMMQFMVRVYA